MGLVREAAILEKPTLDSPGMMGCDAPSAVAARCAPRQGTRASNLRQQSSQVVNCRLVARNQMRKRAIVIESRE